MSRRFNKNQNKSQEDYKVYEGKKTKEINKKSNLFNIQLNPLSFKMFMENKNTFFKMTNALTDFNNCSDDDFYELITNWASDLNNTRHKYYNSYHSSDKTTESDSDVSDVEDSTEESKTEEPNEESKTEKLKNQNKKKINKPYNPKPEQKE